MKPEMRKTAKEQRQLGEQVIKLISDPLKIQPEVTFAPHGMPDCQVFTAFPKELSESFPGSYISPKRLLKELGVGDEKINKDVKTILGSDVAQGIDNPLYNLQLTDENFGLTIWNGSTNVFARDMTRLAAESDFKSDPFARAEYQDALFNVTRHNLQKKSLDERGNSLRIHDDCLASGDSIVGFLAAVLGNKDQKRADTLREFGVEVIIDGPATAQGILFLKAFAKANNINLKIDAGYLAFGLSEGNIVDGSRREHANYITYPSELLKEMDSKTAKALKKHTSNDGNIYVVGDMGDAQRGIAFDTMEVIRTYKKKKDYCSWNDSRQDPHGDHQNRHATLSPSHDEKLVAEDLYLPNGGYLPREWDRLMYSSRPRNANELIIDAGRVWLDAVGYGAAFYEEGKKPR